MAARNEQSRIAAKLDNLLAVDYPPDKLQIIVVSDGSTDDTNEIVESYADRGVHLERLERDQGKAVALNQGVARATSDVLLFCDVRQRIDAQALCQLVAWFDDPRVGAVSGELHLEGDQGPGAYWQYEKAIRGAESGVDSVVGATGALYAVRRTLFKELPPGCLLDDVYTPMQVVFAGYRVGFEPDARVFDQEASIEGEFARKARTLAGNFQLFHLVPDMLRPRRNRIFFQVISHKVLRLVCPFALVLLFLTNLVLVLGGFQLGPLYWVMLFGQLLAYGLAIWAFARTGHVGRLARLCHTFVVLNAAAVEGLRRYLKGELRWTTGR
jgi:cellulose synthase/poly-beta-1,6-N-acetylglucosamine synthase-like glycosyltransferase